MKSLLAEKDSYIGKLEHELNEIRGECERLKDKLIQFELDHLGKLTGAG